MEIQMLVQFFKDGAADVLEEVQTSNPFPVINPHVKWYTNTDTLALTGTAQLLAEGSETASFAAPVKELLITRANLDCYIATTAAAAGAVSSGAEYGRIFIPSGSIKMRIPWTGQNVYFVNVNATETPNIHVIGYTYE
ncbi:MAG: hypothetical protein KY428_05995 [Bacteroidetes bacterium]|nr:hypothetical protein [Bacteroidota bacterium]